MLFDVRIRTILSPSKAKMTWLPVRILHETNKAILVYNGRKFWIPKSRIYGVRLRNNTFEIYVRKGSMG